MMSSASMAAAAKSRRSTSLLNTLIKTGVLCLIHATVLMLVSGRLDWVRAWTYVGFVLGLQIVGAAAVRRTNPDLLEERSRMQKGTKNWDKALAPVVAILGPLAMWCVAAWDVRIHWPPPVSAWWSALGFTVCALGALLMLWAMTANRFFSATVRIQEERGHRVVDSGPYQYVRHPGYTAPLFSHWLHRSHWARGWR